MLELSNGKENSRLESKLQTIITCANERNELAEVEVKVFLPNYLVEFFKETAPVSMHANFDVLARIESGEIDGVRDFILERLEKIYQEFLGREKKRQCTMNMPTSLYEKIRKFSDDNAMQYPNTTSIVTMALVEFFKSRGL